jgi:hypothetical protein
MLEDFDPNRIEDLDTRKGGIALLNLVESQGEQIRLLKEQVQLLRDEIARLKGQQGKPDIKPNKPAIDHSSETQRKIPTVWQKKPKRDFLQVTHTCDLPVDPTTLPSDAEFKGWEEFHVQDLKLVWENICFRREKYYSPSTQKTYLAPLPKPSSAFLGPCERPLGQHRRHRNARQRQERALSCPGQPPLHLLSYRSSQGSSGGSFRAVRGEGVDVSVQ